MASHGTHANPKGISWNIQGSGRAEVVWAGPSNAGLVDPAQCTLIGLANVTVSLLRYAVSDLMADDDVITDQCLALVRQQAVLILMDRAIDAFATIHAQQEREEEELGSMIEASTVALRDTTLMTAEQLSESLDLDAEKLEQALHAAVARGRLNAETRYYTSGHLHEL